MSSFRDSTITAFKTLPPGLDTFDKFLEYSKQFKDNLKDKKKRKREPEPGQGDVEAEVSQEEAILQAINDLKTKIKSWKDKHASWRSLCEAANTNTARVKRVVKQEEVQSDDQPMSASTKVLEPHVRYSLDDDVYLEKHVKGSAWTLPVLIEMTCARHPVMPGVRILAILWYADPYVTEATNPNQQQAEFEAFHWRKDCNGLDRVDSLPSRSGYFHQIVHVQSIVGEDNPTASAGHPAIMLVGRFFSSFNTVPGLFGISKPGWDVWTVRGTGHSMGSIILQGKGFINPKQLVQPFHYPGCVLDYSHLIMERQPRLPARDLLVMMCDDECNDVRCEPNSYAKRQEWVELFNKTRPDYSCAHNFVREALMLACDEGSKKNQRQIYLDAQLTETGRLLSYDDVKVRELDLACGIMRWEYWHLPLFSALSQLQQLHFPQSIPLMQSFYRVSVYDEVLLDNVEAMKSFARWFMPSKFVFCARPSRRSSKPYIEVNTAEERAGMVILSVWGLRRPEYRLLEQWRNIDEEDLEASTIQVVVSMGVLEEFMQSAEGKSMPTEDPFCVEEIYNNVLSKANYDRLQMDVQKCAAELALVKRVSGADSNEADEAERDLFKAKLRCEWAEESGGCGPCPLEMQRYEKQQLKNARQHLAKATESVWE